MHQALSSVDVPTDRLLRLGSSFGWLYACFVDVNVCVEVLSRGLLVELILELLLHLGVQLDRLEPLTELLAGNLVPQRLVLTSRSLSLLGAERS